MLLYVCTLLQIWTEDQNLCYIGSSRVGGPQADNDDSKKHSSALSGQKVGVSGRPRSINTVDSCCNLALNQTSRSVQLNIASRQPGGSLAQLGSVITLMFKVYKELLLFARF